MEKKEEEKKAAAKPGEVVAPDKGKSESGKVKNEAIELPDKSGDIADLVPELTESEKSVEAQRRTTQKETPIEEPPVEPEEPPVKELKEAKETKETKDQKDPKDQKYK